jgi:Zn finger protein HypA/HybF involved in hydrogenase expression
MHEVSLVAELVTACEVRADGRPVRSVHVRHASSISRESLEQAFEMLTEGGPLSGATLVTEPFDVLLACACGFSGALGHDELIGGSMVVCPACGDVSTQPRTAELELVEVS